MKTILFDTDILINYYHKPETNKIFIEKVINKEIIGAISTCTIFELWMGIRNDEEMKKHEALLSFFESFPINNSIAKLAGELAHPLLKYRDQSTDPCDLFIAATAVFFDIELQTNNLKHFEKIKHSGLKLVVS